MSKEVFKAVRISENVFWVGAIDWDLRCFHGYSTSRGSTYNAFLVMSEKIALIDTVKAPFRDEMFARISSVVDLEDISVIVSNHSEMDHTGCIKEAIEKIKPEKVYASVMGQKALERHFGIKEEITPVKNGEKINLGNMELMCLETRMLHWPDSMVSYLDADRVLFSQDAFGMHLASYERFADQIDSSIIEYEARKYFANILYPYAALIPKAVEKISAAGINPEIVAPDHGPVWRTSSDIEKIVGYYSKWSAQKPEKKAVIVYDTMWQSTTKMARAIGEGLQSAGIESLLYSMSGTHRSDILAELPGAGALLIGSPTINNGIFPSIAEIICYIEGLRPKIPFGGAFGSYGWSGEAVKDIEKAMERMKIENVGSVSVEYVPGVEDLLKCFELGNNIGKRIIEKIG